VNSRTAGARFGESTAAANSNGVCDTSSSQSAPRQHTQEFRIQLRCQMRIRTRRFRDRSCPVKLPRQPQAPKHQGQCNQSESTIQERQNHEGISRHQSVCAKKSSIFCLGAAAVRTTPRSDSDKSREPRWRFCARRTWCRSRIPITHSAPGELHPVGVAAPAATSGSGISFPHSPAWDRILASPSPGKRLLPSCAHHLSRTS